MTLQQMQYYKQQKGYSYAKLSELSGVPVGTIQKIFSGETKNPRYETLQALGKALMPTDYRESSEEHELPNMVREAVSYMCEPAQERSAIFGKMGPYTLEDYYALPDDKRVELIDGYFFDMAAPSTIHQIVASEIFWQIKTYIRKKKGVCIPFSAPVDVQIDCNDKTMVQPDVLIVCDRSKIINRCIMGAPDFVVEVLSDSTKRKDATTKLAKYRDAGVREYWMVDAGRKRVVTYFFDEDELPMIYGFEDEIPVHLYGGELQIDFNEVLAELEVLE